MTNRHDTDEPTVRIRKRINPLGAVMTAVFLLVAFGAFAEGAWGVGTFLTIAGLAFLLVREDA